MKRSHEETFHQRGYTGNKYMKTHSISLAIRKKQIKNHNEISLQTYPNG